MILFDGTYSFQGSEFSTTDPPKEWSHYWRVRIIDFSKSLPDVKHLIPFGVVGIPGGTSLIKTSCAESIGRKISEDFELEVKKVLWIEYFPDEPKGLYVAALNEKYIENDVYFQIGWRPIRPNELSAIIPYIHEFEITT